MNKIFRVILVLCLATSMMAACSSAEDRKDTVANTGTSGNDAIGESEDIEIGESSTEGFDRSDIDNGSSEEFDAENRYFEYGKWDDFSIQIDGVTFTLPCKYTDFVSALGQEIDKHDEYDVPAGCSLTDEISLLSKSSSYIYAQVKVINLSQEDLPKTECMVVRFEITDSKIDEWEHDIVLPGDIRLGDAINESELVSRLGNMSWMRDRGAPKSYNWNMNQEYPEHNGYQINTNNGIVNKVVLDYTYVNGFPTIDPSDIPKDPDKLGTDWKTFNICVGGTKLELPSTVK